MYLTYRSKGNSWVTTSTGAACGESLDQCMWKGIAEIFERDAFQYIWRRQLSCPKIDIDENVKLAEEYEVMVVPTLLFVKDGEFIHRESGFFSKDKFKSLIDAYLK